eukprot:scaffold459669_cov36-Prasinocladus_malaysianus.AAC.1
MFDWDCLCVRNQVAALAAEKRQAIQNGSAESPVIRTIPKILMRCTLYPFSTYHVAPPKHAFSNSGVDCSGLFDSDLRRHVDLLQAQRRARF